MLLDRLPEPLAWAAAQTIWVFVFLWAVTFRSLHATSWRPEAPLPAVEPHSNSSLTTWLRVKYAWTAGLYDVLDFPWERYYRRWRPRLVGDLIGDVLELGVGTGRNLPYYPMGAKVTGIDLSSEMIARARARIGDANLLCEIRALEVADAADLETSAAVLVPAESVDVVVASFLFCVLPDELQPAALAQMHRALRPGGKFRLVELVYSGNPKRRWMQQCWAPFVEWMYGARFDRRTLDHVSKVHGLVVDGCHRLNPANDALVLIEGHRAQ